MRDPSRRRSVLLVEDNPGDARLIEILLASSGGEPFEVVHAPTLGEALGRLDAAPVDVVLLDLSLPDSLGLDTVDRMRRAHPELPIVVLSGTGDDDLALEAVKRGAQDYLVKGSAEGDLIRRALRYAIERHTLARRLMQAEAAFRYTDSGLMVFDHDFQVARVNPAFTRLTGFEGNEVVGLSAGDLDGWHVEGPSLTRILGWVAERGGWDGEVVARRKDQATFPALVRVNPMRDPMGAVAGYVAVLTDITDHKRHEAELVRRATTDALTGLPNRPRFEALLAEILEALTHGERRGDVGRVGLLFVDLDHFKDVNDTLGHDAGDELLRQVADRLRRAVRTSDTVARLGGDEFTILLTRIADLADAETVAGKVVRSLSRAFTIGEDEVSISGSVGIALAPEHGSNGEALLRAADHAMYRAKRAGKNTFASAGRDAA
ncbi:diguanylate cyclase domain-containing protein [Roseospirillum parvum]|uniref:PAS domain S-box-containing protein/diguanylate cyclase (GGDEF) domain-containing protein n=1 Tax=Roseospirillum parvum TaxID=83401 RepID=A0A1G7VA51_9PROT|nr:diguanylate cyclase [Roseospirillum parvum]SDG56458.1 PAS domain S-box-containing protein/diguanylate cyclase (GGDEF) domain-containing protein [Roseospirillum parvum]